MKNILFFLLFIGIQSYAQISNGGEPIGFSYLFSTSAPTYNTPSIPIEKVTNELMLL